jgi:hypothetical protein
MLIMMDNGCATIKFLWPYWTCSSTFADCSIPILVYNAAQCCAMLRKYFYVSNGDKYRMSKNYVYVTCGQDFTRR